ncbi:hypothetical protein Nepgr_021982 [Nepenthes gracilis]|uniref:Uncharacterized protein n=1 Tax=Nepenthes gracilis TaxID=150966 RepID=A0AAD3SZW8_NEPGR|nr:hypothetical protein Nepgr_021982 [Nepenthes gracilis]
MNADKAKRIKKTTGWYAILDGRLYRQGYSTPYLKCLTAEEAEYALSKIHLSICGSHIGGKNLTFKIMRQVEVTNCTLLHGLKTKLEDAGGSSVDELPSVLWSYRTTPQEPTRETPFNLCYGVEAVVPIEVGLPYLRVKCFGPATNIQRLRECRDLLLKVRNGTCLRTIAYQ